MHEVPRGGPALISAFDMVTGSDALARAIALERDGGDWRNANCVLNIAGQILGGQLAAHCIAAAMPPDDTFEPSSLHVLFVGGGDPGRHYRVRSEALRGGQRIAHRSVRIEQDGNTVVSAAIILRSDRLAVKASSFSFRGSMPDVPPPEALWLRALAANDSDPLNRAMMASYPYFEIRGPKGYVPGMTVLDGTRDYYWLRIADSTSLAPLQHYALITLASDFWYTLPVHGLGWLGPRPSFMMTSLDHAIWFHRRPACGEWMLVETQALLVDQGIGLMSAKFWSRSGQPVATVMQQAVIRG